MTFFNSNNKYNVMNFGYNKKLGFKVQKINIRAQKVNSSILKIFEIVSADFQVENKENRPKFFQKTFLIANIKFEVILEILFLKICKADMLLGEEKFIWEYYTINKVLFTTKQF